MTAPAIAATWADVHVGDVVLGLDGAGWQVRSRDPGSRWLGAGGNNDIFRVRSMRDGREVKAARELHHPVRLVERADHSDTAEAVNALLGAGFTVHVLREGAMTDQPEQHETAGVETFGAGVAPESDMEQCARGQHPGDQLSTLRDGSTYCTRCMTTVSAPAVLDVHEPQCGCGRPQCAALSLATEDVPGALQAATPAPDGSKGGGALVTGPSTPAKPEPCQHPADALRAILDGSTWCSLCKTTVLASGGNAAVVNALLVDQLADPTPRREAPRGRWGWYKLPHPTTGEPDKIWPRVSTIAKTLADETGLTAWKLRSAVKGLAMRRDLIAVAAALDIDMDKSKLDEVVKSALEVAQTSKGANLGTAVHKFAERLDDGEGIGSMSVPPDLVADLEAYARTLKEHGLEVLPQYTECTVVNVTHEYAGTWDRVVRHRATGALYVLDLKTGQDLSYSWLEHVIQQAAYANAEFVCSRDFTSYNPMPDVDKLKSLILHLPIGSARGEIYGLAINEGWRAFITSTEARAHRTAARKSWSWLVKPQDPADVIRLHLQRAQTQDEFAAVASNAITRGLWTDELAAYAVERFDVVRALACTGNDELAALWSELYPLGRWTEAVNAAALERSNAAPVAA